MNIENSTRLDHDTLTLANIRDAVDQLRSKSAPRTLPYDYARCQGVVQPGCEVCRRREPGRPEYQSQMMPDMDPTGYCRNRIGPTKEFQK